MSVDERFSVPDVPEMLPAACPVSGLPIRSQPEWTYTSPERTYRTTIALIGDATFWVIPRGYITEADMAAATTLATAVLAEALPQRSPFTFIENFAHTQGGTVGARRRYLQFTNSLEGLLGSFPYGLPPFFRLSFNLSRRLRLHRYRVHMTARYEDAVASALAMLKRHGVNPGSPPTAHFGPVAHRPAPPLGRDRNATPGGDSGRVPDAHVEALLAYLGGLDLEAPGVPPPPDMDAQRRLRPVYEALAVLKMDMDQILSEHHALVAGLQERHRQLRDHSAAIERRNRELQHLLAQSAGDRTALGRQVRYNAETLLKPLLRHIERTAGVPPAPSAAGIDAFIDDLFPRQGLRHYRLTPQEIRVARLIRAGARSRAIARRMGLSVHTVATFRRRLREKLGIRGGPRNLQTVLQALPDE